MGDLFLINSLITLWFPAIIILMLSTVAGRWVVLGKMGRRRWAAIIPIFSTWEVAKGASGSRALSVVASVASAVQLLSVLLGLGRYFETQWLAALVLALWLVMQLVVSERLARAFGAGPGYGYAVGLVLLPFVAYPLLVAENRVYLGPVDEAAA